MLENMKSIKQSFKIVALAASLSLLLPSCGQNFLKEKPYTVFTTEYFKTPQGYFSGIVSVYSSLRLNFGPIGYMALANYGTDEWTGADQAFSSAWSSMGNECTYNITSQDGNILTPWNASYQAINTCNALIQDAADLDVDATTKAQYVGEAHFLRGLTYFMLVSQFGAVPVDLGAGDFQFNTTPTHAFNRLPVADVLVKDYQGMIDDLTFASQNLPDQRPTGAFRASKAIALHWLAKVYLFRGYSAAAQSTDFQMALATAKQLIDNAGQYGVALQQDYGTVHAQGNDYNSEILFSVERMPLNNSANEYSDPTQFNDKYNAANNLFACYQINGPASYPNNTKIQGQQILNVRYLEYGRPLRQFCPTSWLLNTCFAERTNDSRFSNSFRTVFTAISDNGASSTAKLADDQTHFTGLGFNMGDTVIYLAATEADAAQKLAAGKKYLVIPPSQFYNNQQYHNSTSNMYPNLKKFDDTKRAFYNDASGRPYKVSRFSETYLIAAEAAMQTGDNNTAATYINVIRERAAYRPGLDAATLTARQQAMDITAADINLDFILDERARELCGEGWRWTDLAMRHKLVDRIKANNPDGAPNVQSFHELRPIPQSQLDAMSDTNKQQYQNPGYN